MWGKAAKCRYRMTKCRPRNLSLQGIPRYHKRCIDPFCENSDERQDNDFFEDKGFGFITDENGENRYFHVIKVQNPELIKKNAAVTFEPTNNTKGPSAYAVKVLAPSKYIIIANERIKIASIKSFNTFTKEVPVKADVDKENTVLSVGLLMNRIRPQSEDQAQAMQTLRMLTITTFQNTTHTFSEHEIDMDETIKALKSL